MASRLAPTDTRERLLALAILLLAGLLRVGWPTLTEFKFDEARLAALALELTQHGHLPLVGLPSSAGFDHSPLSVYLYAPAFLFTASPIPATLYSGLMGMTAVGLCGWLARRWPGGGRWAALVAAGLFAVSPWAVAFSRKIWQVTFVPPLALLFVGLMISALVEERHWRLAPALTVYAVLVQVHPSAISLAPALLLWLLLFRRQIKFLPLVVGSLAAAATALPFLLHQAWSGWPALTALGSLRDPVVDSSALRLGWQAITGSGIFALAGRAYPLLKAVPQFEWTFRLVGWLNLTAVLSLAWRGWTRWRSLCLDQRNESRIDLVLLSWLVFPLVLNLRHSLDLYLHSFLLVVPAACLIIGRAAGPLLQQRGNGALTPCVRASSSFGRLRSILRIGLVGLLLCLASGQAMALVVLGHLVASEDTAGGFGVPLRQYLAVANMAADAAGRSHASEVLVVGQGDSPVVDETAAIFDVLLRGRVQYRFVDVTATALFPRQHALALLAPSSGVAGEWYKDPSWPTEDLPSGYRLVQLNGVTPEDRFSALDGPRLFQNGVELLGLVWQGDAAPGTRGRLWLLWQVLWRSPANTHFFVHVIDAEGGLVTQQDSAGYPAEYREPGDWVISEFDITFPTDAPASPYFAQSGMYLFPQVKNVPVIDGAGNAVADRVNLGPLPPAATNLP